MHLTESSKTVLTVVAFFSREQLTGYELFERRENRSLVPLKEDYETMFLPSSYFHLQSCVEEHFKQSLVHCKKNM